MCGICGAVWTSARKQIDLTTLDRVTDALTKRGPDDRGSLRLPLTPGVPSEEKGVALGHRRLAIVDLSSAGRQPFVNDDKTLYMTFNGEIYNYVEIRDELRRRGRTFRTETDVEVLMKLYEEFGLDCLPKLNGMFAFAVWDAREQRLLLARDRIGKKPLVYRLESDRLLFASELKALKEFPDVPRDVDLIALRQYLTYQYVPYPRTIYEGTSKLPPASCLIWKEGQEPKIERYWRAEDVGDFDDRNLPDDADVDRLVATGALGAATFGEPYQDDAPSFYNRSFEETKRELRRRLENAVKIRMRCDVPFGAFLSGGIDSTIVVGLMRKFSPNKVRTFSIGFAQKKYDETPFARRTAERFGTEHTEFFVEPDAEAILPALVAQFDEPFADSSAIPTWYLCETTRREVTVALGGDGGDELFCGYDRYKAVKLSQYVEKLPYALRRLLAGPIRSMLPNTVSQRSVWRRGRRFLETIGMDALEQYLQWIAIFNRSRLDSVLSDEYWSACRADTPRPQAAELDCCDFLQDAFDKFKRRDLTTAISFADVLTYLPCDIMTKVDITSMRSSLETRAPLLDPNVAELALQIPLAYKLKGKRGKHILREACAELLPEEIDARPKTGFGVPLDDWFRGPLNKTLRDVLLDPSTRRAPWFNADFVERLIREHEERQFDHAARLWSLLVFRLWESQQ
ncbi:MAG: asparagine synthase (glutamine-hydrolyzing) [Thermoguttaceae bacterium]|nr:asparagine synthase (glutamine-hydrolyzing) [Thermoguttaceae bacterium]